MPDSRLIPDYAFGATAITAEALFEGIAGELSQTGTPALRNHDRLTTALRTGLRRLAEDRALELATGPYGEFLVDHVWRKGRSGIFLVAESEWRRDDCHIRQDFEKLLIFKAPTKLFVYQSNPERRACDALRIATECLALYEQHSANEEYVLIEVTPRHARGFLCKVSTDGRMETPMFTEIRGSPRSWS